MDPLTLITNNQIRVRHLNMHLAVMQVEATVVIAKEGTVVCWIKQELAGAGSGLDRSDPAPEMQPAKGCQDKEIQASHPYLEHPFSGIPLSWSLEPRLLDLGLLYDV